MLSPIFVSVYDRFDHFKNCIESLKRCSLSSESILYISSDGPKSHDDQAEVIKIRNYISSLTGFKDIELLAPKKNTRGKVISEMKELIWQRHNKMIRMEDDNILHPSFLEFINDSLDRFENNSSIFSICGYTPPLEDFNSEPYIFRLPWHEPWGYGVWKDRWLNFNPNITSHDLLNSKSARNKMKAYGKFMYDSAWLDCYEFSRAEDARVGMHMLRHNLSSIFPSHSLVSNHGHDGSGVHAGHTSRFNVELNLDVKNFINLADRGLSHNIIDKYVTFIDGGIIRSTVRSLGLYRLRYIIKYYLGI